MYLLSQQEIDDIRLATERVGKIFAKTAAMLRQADDQTLWELDFPEETYRYIRMKTIEAESVIARVDLVRTPRGYKVLEINADTPTFIKECFHINSLICRELGVRDPNSSLELELAAAVNTSVMNSYQFIGGNSSPHVVFASHGDHIEDRLTTEYLMGISGLAGAVFCPLSDLRLDEYGLYDQYDRKIDVLYRQTYPIEHLINDRNPETGMNLGLLLLNQITHKKIAVVNPPSAFLLQSKGPQVVIWGLHEQGAFFTEQEHQWIADYMLPTYFEHEWFIEDEMPYVKKPCFGREGDTVEVFNAQGFPIYTNTQRSYTDSAPVYQKFVELPRALIKTVEGEKEAHLLTGCFLINGKASAVGIRAGNMITDNASYYLPVGVK